MSKYKFLTTPIYYPNGKPHMGHAFTNMQTDIMVRMYNLYGYETLFSTGVDEHGTKVQQKAESNGLSPQAWVDQLVENFYSLNNLLDLSEHRFVRTSDGSHEKLVKDIWMKISENDDFYLKDYEGLYCVGSESFIKESDLIDGNCPGFGVPPVKMNESNYFFKLSKYLPKIKEMIEKKEIDIHPEYRAKEVLNMIEHLGDFSVSRPKTSLEWGIEVPNDADHVMYVWIDALSNYLTVLGYPENMQEFEKFWPNVENIIGKDILKFHSIYFPAMCLSLGIKPVSKIYAHGMILVDGQKMSKSIGNVIDPIAVIEKYGSDVVRFSVNREMPMGSDGDFSEDRLQEIYASDLQSNIGNLFSRVVTMSHKFCDGEIKSDDFTEIKEAKEKLESDVFKHLENFEVRKMNESILEFSSFLNKYVEENKPWALNKEGNLDRLNVVLSNLLEGIRFLACFLSPILTKKSQEMQQILNFENFNLALTYKVGDKVNTISPLFPNLTD